jgi:hypothetical protein
MGVRADQQVECDVGVMLNPLAASVGMMAASPSPDQHVQESHVGQGNLASVNCCWHHAVRECPAGFKICNRNFNLD